LAQSGSSSVKEIAVARDSSRVRGVLARLFREVELAIVFIFIALPIVLPLALNRAQSEGARILERGEKFHRRDAEVTKNA
jgi:hypothetical protein